ncbi:hypothetical protein [Virgibacillus sp. DJP39]|uniref:hypothetical protein n=1 Tax=Virgibacillus sp. DJP39 TaxID=3409790 RepID=UPI003BB64003
MERSLLGNNRKKGIIIFVVTALLIVGGSVAAFVLLNFSDKQKYFLAEKSSIEAISEQFNNRFEPELNWQEKVQENPTESTYELSATYNDPSANVTLFGPSQIINNSTLTLKNATDFKNKKMATEISGAFGGITIDGLSFYLTSEKLLVELPFLKELLQMKEGDIGQLLKELDPQMYTGKEKIDYDTFFNRSSLSESDQEYLKEEYLEMIYDSLPDESFQASEETVEVNSTSFNAEKIVFHLTEKQLKKILSTTLEKMKSDQRLKEIIKEQVALRSFGAGMSTSSLTPSVESDIDEMINEFETTLDHGIEQLKTIQIPDGLKSTIWVTDDSIIQRELVFSVGPSNGEIVTFNVSGKQFISETDQTFDYTFSVKENQNASTLALTGDLSWKNNEANDSIKLVADGLEVGYDGNSTLTDGKREFERIFTLNTEQDQGSLSWSGNAMYNKNEMSSEHSLTIQAPEMPKDMLSLQLSKDARLIKEVTIPSGQNVKDIGSMTADEIMQYFQTEVTPKFQQWVMGIMGSGGF